MQGTKGLRDSGLPILLLLAALPLAAQTTNVAISSTVRQANAQPGGMNLGGFDYYWDFGYKNFIAGWGNPGFERLQQRQIYAVEDSTVTVGAGLYTATQVQANLNNLQYDGAPLNYYSTNGAQLNVVYSTGAELGCSEPVTASTTASSSFSVTPSAISGSGTITVTVPNVGSNTVGAVIGIRVRGVTGGTGTLNGVFTATIASSTTLTYTSAGANASGASVGSATVSSGQGVMYTFTACGASLQPGDLFTLTWGSNANGNLAPGISTTGGATATSESSDVCTSVETTDPNYGDGRHVYNGCGQQSFSCSGTSASWSCTIQYGFDNTSVENFLLANGNYLTSFMAKAAAGSPTIDVTVARTGSGGFASYNYAPTLLNSWTQYSQTNALAETCTTCVLGQIQVKFIISGTGTGTVYLDNAFWGPQTSSGSTNETIFRDQLVSTLKAYNPGTLRNWYGGGQNATSIANELLPLMVQQTSNAGFAYANTGTAQYSIGEFLALNQALGTTPAIVFPACGNVPDIENLMDYLFGGSGTTYGALRIAQGGPSASGGWATVFPTIHVAFGNEQWNPGEVSQGLGYRAGSTSLYQDMATRANQLWAAAVAWPSYNAAAKLTIGVQTAQSPTYTAAALGIAPQTHTVELNGYTAYAVTNAPPTPVSNYVPTLTEPFARTHAAPYQSASNDASGQYQQMQQCITSGVECVIYEENNGTFSGLTQAQADAFVNAGVYTAVTCDQILNNIDAGYGYQGFFEISQYWYASAAPFLHAWGAVTDMGGQQSLLNATYFGGSYNARPNFLGGSVCNAAVIGPEVTSTVTNPIPYSISSASNSVNPISNVPTIEAFSFQSGSNVAVALLNKDTATSYPVTFSGALAPSGTVNQVQVAPPALSAINEATGTSATRSITATVYPRTSTLSAFNPSVGITLPPYSVTVLSFAMSTSTVATPAFSPVAGTYFGTQSVTISTATGGATICYTTDGSTPLAATPGTCSHGTTYSGAVTVSSSETLKAIGTLASYTNSAVATAAYTINALVNCQVFGVANTVATVVICPH